MFIIDLRAFDILQLALDCRDLGQSEFFHAIHLGM